MARELLEAVADPERTTWLASFFARCGGDRPSMSDAIGISVNADRFGALGHPPKAMSPPRALLLSRALVRVLRGVL